jgi:hypothetical protein
MYIPCLWYVEEWKRQVAEHPEKAPLLGDPNSMTFLSVTMPNGDIYRFDLCLIHGEIRPLPMTLAPKEQHEHDNPSPSKPN